MKGQLITIVEAIPTKQVPSTCIYIIWPEKGSDQQRLFIFIINQKQELPYLPPPPLLNKKPMGHIAHLKNSSQ